MKKYLQKLLYRLKGWLEFRLSSPLHQRKRTKANDVLATLESIRGEFREPKIITYLRKLDPFVFEELLLSALERNGHQVKRNKRYTGDNGIDGIFYKNGQPVYIQAKRYSGHISLEDVLQFIDTVNRHRVRGLFIHTGKTGEEVKRQVRSSSVEIISGSNLVAFITERS
jgi:restriction system protein